MPQGEIDISILKYRKEKRISQADFGRLVGVKQATVSNWESRKVNPSGKNLERIRELVNPQTPETKPISNSDELALLKELLLAKEEIIVYLKTTIDRIKEG
ncbi:helix-turn-helix transcriptional regulator [Ulvibacterium marinum]|uniref:helix-turn-helix transcriptional regulator n=1 Tax=Ulvibacterium marinum TaxID=2419782 RepID=UPI0024953137|nr:helix-turn-helix transcriptional regulator [Ulvibacterium marinum]